MCKKINIQISEEDVLRLASMYHANNASGNNVTMPVGAPILEQTKKPKKMSVLERRRLRRIQQEKNASKIGANFIGFIRENYANLIVKISNPNNKDKFAAKDLIWFNIAIHSKLNDFVYVNRTYSKDDKHFYDIVLVWYNVLNVYISIPVPRLARYLCVTEETLFNFFDGENAYTNEDALEKYI